MLCFLLIAALSIRQPKHDEGDLLEEVLDELKSLRQELKELQESLPKEKSEFIHFGKILTEQDLPKAPVPEPAVRPPDTAARDIPQSDVPSSPLPKPAARPPNPDVVDSARPDVPPATPSPTQIDITL
ncbi:hypothetical protein TVAG_064590 [Trichomonas vaginalis G3]|uniref:Uncharacterized protein n=1 Tax=Trichomonas vaginalis (strain ATCC PRA-98 / G3) TaxID=412133 RepID=A2EHD4_TRIV3|nr:hypothetical protein TVAGG3_0350140 [Trichomonas vaginalis G3]EAY07912.1 hypothetical protein TVAG_064590 [Trichomonas vaginalis G3]KAI5531224.1 hypothetical protein TVAGG3_0350140 [Trichomonas vaginalis G3]|eukprot:XP_001320135.1 hypothetical protein [Trichomonas vaginalis G3]